MSSHRDLVGDQDMLTVPSLSAIVVSYNSAAVLGSCIEALHEQLAPEELLVVDNASRDNSSAIARALGAEVIGSRSNGGFGAGCNLGARSARNEVLLFVNPDVCITMVDAAELGRHLAQRPLGLLAPRGLLGADGERDEPSLRRSLPWPCNVVREALSPVLPRDLSFLLSTSLDAPGRDSWLSGALLFCARAEFLALGGFDERLFLYYEDRELSRRYALNCLPLSTTDAIAAGHVRGGSSNDQLRPIPRAASALSSVEFVAITKGPRSARLAWDLFRALRTCAAAIMRLAARGPLSARGSRKLEELRSTQGAIQTLVQEPVAQYPFIKSLIRGLDR